ncbi:hypothetical protein [Kitasatospora sp. NPDC058190]|uniref:hypothetical protein n=1 Tax=Kitasatospora sp. NPDC058190 TaxID=3346371 RepID=UPI0036D7E70A
MTTPESTKQPSEAPATVAQEPDRVGNGWREELETTRLARLAVAWLPGPTRTCGPGPELAVLVEEFERMRAALAASWTWAADLLEAVPHHPTALTGPYWYGQGWDEAVHHLWDMADATEPAPRRASPQPEDPKGRP